MPGHVEVVREAVEAANASDPDAFVACLHPEVEWVDSGDPLPGLRGVYRGPAEVRRWFEEAFGDTWESSRVEIELRAWHVLWFTDDKIATRQVFGLGRRRS